MILDYIKGFLTLFILVRVLLYFVPKNVFEKYIAFFSGVILVIGLLYPFLQMFGQEKVILEKWDYEQWEEQLLEISQDAEKIEKAGAELVEEYYQENTEATKQKEVIAIETVKIGNEAQAGDVDE